MEAKRILQVSDELHAEMKAKAAELRITLGALTEQYLRKALGSKTPHREEPVSHGYRGNAFSGVDLDLEKMGLASEDDKEDEDDEE